MGSEQSSLAKDNKHPVASKKYHGGKTLSPGQGGRKSYATEATTRTSGASLFSGEFATEHASHTFEVQAVITEDDDEATDDTSILEDDSDDEESDDEVAEQGR